MLPRRAPAARAGGARAMAAGAAGGGGGRAVRRAARADAGELVQFQVKMAKEVRAPPSHFAPARLGPAAADPTEPQRSRPRGGGGGGGRGGGGCPPSAPPTSPAPARNLPASRHRPDSHRPDRPLGRRQTESLDLDLGVITPGVEHLFEDPGKGEYFVVCEDGGAGEILGSLMVTYEWSDWRNGLVWWIQSVYVRPEFRGQGLFKALYAFVKDDCKARGAIGLRLYADQDNARAIEVYKRLGMTSHYRVFEDMWNE